MLRPTLSIAWRRQETVHQTLVSIGGLIEHKAADFFGSRWQAVKIEGEAADQFDAISLGRRSETIFFELGAERRAEMGIPESMIRLSVGIEDLDDLLEDFKTALGE